MRTPGEIIDALHVAGATLVVENGKARLRGAMVPPALLKEVKERRDEIIVEWGRRQEAAQDRYAEVPKGAVPMLGMDVDLTPRQMEMVLRHVIQQPRSIHAWVMRRVQEYFERGVPAEQCDVAACVDVLAWQRNTSARLALEWLQNLTEVAEAIKTKVNE